MEDLFEGLGATRFAITLDTRPLSQAIEVPTAPVRYAEHRGYGVICEPVVRMPEGFNGASAPILGLLVHADRPDYHAAYARLLESFEAAARASGQGETAGDWLAEIVRSSLVSGAVRRLGFTGSTNPPLVWDCWPDADGAADYFIFIPDVTRVSMRLLCGDGQGGGSSPAVTTNTLVLDLLSKQATAPDGGQWKSGQIAKAIDRSSSRVRETAAWKAYHRPGQGRPQNLGDRDRSV